jgi:hypothetical protein
MPSFSGGLLIGHFLGGGRQSSPEHRATKCPLDDDSVQGPDGLRRSRLREQVLDALIKLKYEGGQVASQPMVVDQCDQEFCCRFLGGWGSLRSSQS